MVALARDVGIDQGWRAARGQPMDPAARDESGAGDAEGASPDAGSTPQVAVVAALRQALTEHTENSATQRELISQLEAEVGRMADLRAIENQRLYEAGAKLRADLDDVISERDLYATKILELQLEAQGLRSEAFEGQEFVGRRTSLQRSHQSDGGLSRSRSGSSATTSWQPWLQGTGEGRGDGARTPPRGSGTRTPPRRSSFGSLAAANASTHRRSVSGSGYNGGYSQHEYSGQGQGANGPNGKGAGLPRADGRGGQGGGAGPGMKAQWVNDNGDLLGPWDELQELEPPPSHSLFSPLVNELLCQVGGWSAYYR